MERKRKAEGPALTKVHREVVSRHAGKWHGICPSTVVPTFASEGML